MKSGKINKVISLFVVLLTIFSCSKSNTVPEITGVSDGVVKAGVEFNAMADITAKDKEDGDITSKITIESTPSIDFKNGKATIEKAGNYELVYKVTDKDGNEVEAYSTLTVTKKTSDAIL